MKRLLLWGGSLLLFLGLAAVLLDIPVIMEGYLRHESFFQGKPTSYWKQKLAYRDRNYELVLKEFQKGGAAAVPVLVESLKDDKATVREGAALALRKLGPEQARDAVPGLEEALKVKDGPIRIQVAKTLVEIDPSSTKAAPALIECLGDP